MIPRQIRMVFGSSEAHAVGLDQGHSNEFIAAAGLDLTSQYLELRGQQGSPA